MKDIMKVILPFAILAIGAVGAIVLVKSRPDVERQSPPSPAPLVRAMPARPQDVQVIIDSQGTVSPRTETSLIAEVAGRVIRVAPTFESGVFFKKGDLLLQIDPTDHELAVVQAKSEVAQAELALAQQEAEAVVARDEWADLDGGEASPLASRDLHVQQARAMLEAAQARQRQAERNLDRARIRAPYVGRVRQRTADLGQYVTPGTPLGAVYATDYAEVRLPIPDSDLPFVELPEGDDGPSPIVTLIGRYAGETRTWEARIVRVEGEIDPLTRMINVIARVEDPFGSKRHDAPLSPGLFVEAEIGGRIVDEVLVVPRSILRSGDKLIVIDAETKLRERPAQVLRVSGEKAFVRVETSADEMICLTDLEVFIDGMDVRVKEVQPIDVDGGLSL